MRQARLPTPPPMASVPLILGRPTTSGTSGPWWGAALEQGVGSQGPSSPSIPSGKMLRVRLGVRPRQGPCSLAEWARWQWEAGVFGGSETGVGWQVTLQPAWVFGRLVECVTRFS